MRRKISLAIGAIFAVLVLTAFTLGDSFAGGGHTDEAEEYGDYMAGSGMMGPGMMGPGMMGKRKMGMMGPHYMMFPEKVEIEVKEMTDGVTVTLKSSDPTAAKQVKLMAQMMKLMHEMMKLQMQQMQQMPAAPKPMK